ncbi:phospholipase B1, membrane-associated-like [Drosophila innubila]|uniref:phospholipase B1, membrane-associated-like n=1 Tax=Drosophila innubila TaxID=198719 RepID=UPI00148E1038|nr:phospholipase B1, membrane-associated-like [Drosophila innubila]
MILLLLILTLLSLSRGRPNSSIVNHSTQLLRRLGVKRVPFQFDPYKEGLYYTNLDQNLRQVILNARNWTQISTLSNIDFIRAHNVELGRMQQTIPASSRFPCNLSQTRSPDVASHISRLRPGDIDIVAAFGDSTIAGTGIMALGFWDLMVEYRGFAYTGDGIESWRTVLTLPNILKLYNPNLYGYAVAHSLSADVKRSRLNVAEPMLYLLDLPFQVHVLIDRLHKDPKVNIHVGPNDICSELCYWHDLEAFLRLEERQLYASFRLLRDNVPRLLINFIIQPDIDDVMNVFSEMPDDCTTKASFFCNCHGKYKQEKYYNVAKRFFDMQKSIASLPELQRDDFAIVTHEIFKNVSNLWSRNGALDKRFMANDCIHYSQLAHAVLAKLLWNNMLNQTDFTLSEARRRPFEYFLCPNADRQFLRTTGDRF